MLAPESEVVIDMIYMGPGNGCRQELRCDAIGFKKQVDSHNQRESMRQAAAELDHCLFQAFLSGDYYFKPSERNQKAREIIELSDCALIERIYEPDLFAATIVREELTRRGLWNDDIFVIGKHSNELAKAEAIRLLKTNAELD